MVIQIESGKLKFGSAQVMRQYGNFQRIRGIIK